MSLVVPATRCTVMPRARSPRSGAPLACLLAGLLPAPLHAETAAGEWDWSATLYLWLPSVDGQAALPPSGGGPAIEIGVDALLDSLDTVFMGALEVRRGPWSLATDVVYIDFEASKHATRQFGLDRVEIPSTINADLRLGLTGWLWSMDGSYALLQRDPLSMSILAGARMLDIKEDLHYTFNGDISSLPLAERTGSARAQQTQWDAIVGLKGRIAMGAEGQWYVPYHVDVGTGESRFTWQAMVGLGYSFRSVDVLGIWRYLDYDLGNSTPIQSIDFNGPAVGVTFRF
jgi:hypothetical protein